MTNWIPQYITNGITESSNSQTLMKDLPKNEQVGMLMLELRKTNSATIYNTRSIMDEITKIEIIADGSKVIASAQPEVLSYLAFVAQGGEVPDHRFFKGGAAVQRLHLPIWFGRYPWDEEYLLDTGQYSTVQVWITYALDTAYSASGSFQHTITYWRPLTKLPVKGFIRSREIKVEVPSAAAQTIRHDLPVTYPWHLVGARIHDVDQDINTNLTGIELNIDSGRLLLVDTDADEIYYENMRKFRPAHGYVNQPVVIGAETDVQTFGEWAFPRGAVTVSGNRLPVLTGLAGETVDITVYVADTGVAATDAIPIALDMPSSMPHKCMLIGDFRKWPFPIRNYKEAWIDYVMAAYTITLRTFVQEVVAGKL